MLLLCHLVEVSRPDNFIFSSTPLSNCWVAIVSSVILSSLQNIVYFCRLLYIPLVHYINFPVFPVHSVRLDARTPLMA